MLRSHCDPIIRPPGVTSSVTVPYKSTTYTLITNKYKGHQIENHIQDAFALFEISAMPTNSIIIHTTHL